MAHEALPDARGQASAGHALHRRMVVIADPHAHHQFVGEADEPRIAVVLACAGLPGHAAGHRRGVSGAVLDDPLQQFDHLLLEAERLPVARRHSERAQHLTFETERADSPRFKPAAGPHRGEGTGEIEQAHLIGAQRKAGHLRERSVEAEIARRRHHLVQADLRRSRTAAVLSEFANAVASVTSSYCRPP